MGTQQILMVVLSVIVVGAAVAVGIQMFDTQALNAQRTSITADLQNFGGQVLAHTRTPQSMGGAQGLTKFGQQNLSVALGFDATTNKLTNANGTYTITADAATLKCVIVGVSSDSKVQATATIDATKTPSEAISIVLDK